MFTKTEARIWVLRSVVESCRKKALTLKTGDLSLSARQKDVTKAQAALRDYADRQDKALQKLLTRHG